MLPHLRIFAFLLTLNSLLNGLDRLTVWTKEMTSESFSQLGRILTLKNPEYDDDGYLVMIYFLSNLGLEPQNRARIRRQTQILVNYGQPKVTAGPVWWQSSALLIEGIICTQCPSILSWFSVLIAKPIFQYLQFWKYEGIFKYDPSLDEFSTPSEPLQSMLLDLLTSFISRKLGPFNAVLFH